MGSVPSTAPGIAVEAGLPTTFLCQRKHHVDRRYHAFSQVLTKDMLAWSTPVCHLLNALMSFVPSMPCGIWQGDRPTISRIRSFGFLV
jgi:hypothetical protein